jgi:hypothetical protein
MPITGSYRSGATRPEGHLLIRRSISDPTEPTYYLGYVPGHCVCSLTDLARVAGTRWAMTTTSKDAEQTVALDGAQVRDGLEGWHVGAIEQ